VWLQSIVASNALVTGQGCATASDEQTKSVVESRGDLIHRERSDTRGCEFQREGHTLHARTDIGDRDHIRLGQRKRGPRGLRARDEQLH
jgi:hypothetical protein